MLTIWLTASFTEKPFQPTSLRRRATNSAGHEYFVKWFASDRNSADRSSRRITARMLYPLDR